MQTQAVVIPEPNRVELQSVTLKTPGPDDVLIETHYTSVSAGTERMLFAGVMPHPMLQLPVVPGYETVGRVLEVGANVAGDLVGRWVYVGGALCYEGINAAWGGQSAKLFTNAERVVPLNELEPRLGVLLALSATALHGVDVLAVPDAARVLVIGQGPVGQLAARLLRGQGAWVAASDRSAGRLALADADVRINADEQSLADAIHEPVDAIIEASGSMPALAAALPLLREGGKILLLGYYQNLEIPYMPLFLKEARLFTAKEWRPGDLQRCRDLIASGQLAVANLLTHTLPIADVQQGYEIALNDLDCLKLVFAWQQ